MFINLLIFIIPKILMNKLRLIFCSLALILQLYKFYQIYLGRNKYRLLADLIKKLSPLTPSQIIDKLKDRSISSSVELCKGIVTSAQSIYSFLNPSVKVLHSHIVQANNLLLNSSSKRIINKRQPSHYIIKDNNSFINLYEIDKTIKVHTHVIRRVKVNIIQKVKSFFRFIIDPNQKYTIANQLFNTQNVYEAYLPQGPQYTVLAKFKKEGGQICSVQPIIMSFPEKRISVFLQNIEFKKTLLLSGVTVGSIVCLSYICYQLIKYYRQYIKNSKQSLLNPLRKIFVKSRLCMICRRKLSCIVNRPCNHMLTCKQCNPHRSQCNQCKQQINQKIQYFAS